MVQVTSLQFGKVGTPSRQFASQNIIQQTDVPIQSEKEFEEQQRQEQFKSQKELANEQNKIIDNKLSELNRLRDNNSNSSNPSSSEKVRLDALISAYGQARGYVGQVETKDIDSLVDVFFNNASYRNQFNINRDLQQKEAYQIYIKDRISRGVPFTPVPKQSNQSSQSIPTNQKAYPLAFLKPKQSRQFVPDKFTPKPMSESFKKDLATKQLAGLPLQSNPQNSIERLSNSAERTYQDMQGKSTEENIIGIRNVLKIDSTQVLLSRTKVGRRLLKSQEAQRRSNAIVGEKLIGRADNYKEKVLIFTAEKGRAKGERVLQDPKRERQIQEATENLNRKAEELKGISSSITTQQELDNYNRDVNLYNINKNQLEKEIEDSKAYPNLKSKEGFKFISRSLAISTFANLASIIPASAGSFIKYAYQEPYKTSQEFYQLGKDTKQFAKEKPLEFGVEIAGGFAAGAIVGKVLPIGFKVIKGEKLVKLKEGAEVTLESGARVKLPETKVTAGDILQVVYDNNGQAVQAAFKLTLKKPAQLGYIDTNFNKIQRFITKGSKGNPELVQIGKPQTRIVQTPEMNVEGLQEIAKKMGIKLKLEDLPFPRLTKDGMVASRPMIMKDGTITSGFTVESRLTKSGKSATFSKLGGQQEPFNIQSARMQDKIILDLSKLKDSIDNKKIDLTGVKITRPKAFSELPDKFPRSLDEPLGFYVSKGGRELKQGDIYINYGAIKLTKGLKAEEVIQHESIHAFDDAKSITRNLNELEKQRLAAEIFPELLSKGGGKLDSSYANLNSLAKEALARRGKIKKIKEFTIDGLSKSEIDLVSRGLGKDTLGLVDTSGDAIFLKGGLESKKMFKVTLGKGVGIDKEIAGGLLDQATATSDLTIRRIAEGKSISRVQTIARVQEQKFLNFEEASGKELLKTDLVLKDITLPKFTNKGKIQSIKGVSIILEPKFIGEPDVNVISNARFGNQATINKQALKQASAILKGQELIAKLNLQKASNRLASQRFSRAVGKLKQEATFNAEQLRIASLPIMVGGQGKSISTFKSMGFIETDQIQPLALGFGQQQPTSTRVLIKPLDLTISKELTKQVPKEISKNINKFLLKDIQKDNLKEVQKEQLKQVQKLNLKQAQKLVLKEIQKVPNPPNIPKIPNSRLRSLKLLGFRGNKNNKESSLSKGFNVQERRRGQFRNVGTDLPRGLAFKLGSSRVRGNLGRTFRLRETGRTTNLPDIKFALSSREFRLPKSKMLSTPLTFVQRSRFSLSSIGEKREIQEARRRLR